MSPLAEIKIRLERARISAAGQPHRDFIPDGSLQRILTAEDVFAVLADPAFQVPSHKIESTAQIVISEGRIIFALLLNLSLERELGRFIEDDCLDQALPLSKSRLEDVIPQAAGEFAKRQWSYRAYQFRKGQYHRKIKDEEILPYIEQERIGGGGFSTVYKVLIHPGYQNVVPDAPSSVRLLAVEAAWWCDADIRYRAPTWYAKRFEPSIVESSKKMSLSYFFCLVA